MILSIVIAIILAAGIWFTSCLIILSFLYKSDIKKLLVEPMLRYPVVIFESDDWGVGPLQQESALNKIRSLFEQYNDHSGNHPVMTLGLILAEPDTDKIIASDTKNYHKITLASARYSTLMKIIQQGIKQGIYRPQLHAMEHFWPDSIMRSSATHLPIKQWLLHQEKRTEDLPSELQSRWVDSSSLPSTEHSVEAINIAIEEELSLYISLFGHLPKVVVPPTFVWTDRVAQVYAKHKVEALVTPGRQCIGRDNHTNLIYNEKSFYNGQENSNGLLYLVRNNYFEPTLGHKAAKVIQSIQQKTDCARPALLEMHRFNFINGQKSCETSLQELDTLLQMILSDFSDIRFISTEQLVTIFKQANQGMASEFIVSSSKQRLKIAAARLKLFLQFKRIAKYSGFNLLLKFC